MRCLERIWRRLELPPAPAPLVGVVGGPVGFLAAAVGFGGYLAIKHFRNRR